MIKKILASSLMLSGATLSLGAYALEIVGEKEAKTLTNQSRPGLMAQQEIPVTLMKIKLSKAEIAALQKTQSAPKNTGLLANAYRKKLS